jgi:hypothetical protein
MTVIVLGLLVVYMAFLLLFLFRAGKPSAGARQTRHPG